MDNLVGQLHTLKPGDVIQLWDANVQAIAMVLGADENHALVRIERFIVVEPTNTRKVGDELYAHPKDLYR